MPITRENSNKTNIHNLLKDFDQIIKQDFEIYSDYYDSDDDDNNYSVNQTNPLKRLFDVEYNKHYSINYISKIEDILTNEILSIIFDNEALEVYNDSRKKTVKYRFLNSFNESIRYYNLILRRSPELLFRYSINNDVLNKIIQLNNIYIKTNLNKNEKLKLLFYYFILKKHVINKLNKFKTYFKQYRLSRLLGPWYLNTIKTKPNNNINNNNNNNLIDNKIQLINTEDVYELTPIIEIEPNKVVSYYHNELTHPGEVYAFHIQTMQKIISDNDTKCRNMNITNMNERYKIKNPYTNQLFPMYFIENCKKLINMMNFYNIQYKDIELTVFSKEQELKNRFITLFQKIERHYTGAPDYLTLYNLSNNDLTTMIRFLRRVWCSQLDEVSQRRICPPFGDPFDSISQIDLFNENLTRDNVIIILEKMMNSARNQDDITTAAFYILGALTKISYDARNQMYWLYEAFNT